MAIQNPPVSQTRSFVTVFLIEMWERFGFYGMQVLMVTYMMKKLGFIDTKANLVWGAAAALIYATPAIGGWVGDKLIGADGCPVRVVAATEVLLGRPCYEVEFSDGAVIVADARHQRLTDTHSSRRAREQARAGAPRVGWPGRARSRRGGGPRGRARPR